MSKLESLKNVVTSKAGRSVLQAQKVSPTIMFAAGVVGVVGTVVLASKATLKLDDILTETEEKAMEAKSLHDKDDFPSYDDAAYRRDMTILHVRQAAKITKLYGPTLLIGVASVGLLTGSHVTLSRRNAGLVAAYAAVQKSFEEYQARVVADVGEEKAREYRFGAEEQIVTSEDDKGKITTKTVKRAAGGSEYSKFFGESNPNFNKSSEHNLIFLKAQERYFNQMLQTRGHVFLNEVYDALSIDRTTAGAVVGWVKDNPKGDNFIDFGVMDDDKVEQFLDFMQGNEGMWLDFNVDGIVYDLI